MFGIYYLGENLYFFPSQSGLAGLVLGVILWLLLRIYAYWGATSSLLGMVNAQEIKEKSQNPQLFNIVDEMCIASGVPLPKIYVVDTDAPNAFAAGPHPKKSVVAVTTGLLRKLNRNELQGVIAHELGHIKNYDIKFMINAFAMVAAVTILTDITWRMIRGSTGRSRSRSGKGGGGGLGLIILVIALALAILAPFAAQLFYFALSRKREYLADASACVFTRYPPGLASALRKISGDTSPLPSSKNTLMPFFIVNPLEAHRKSFSLFSTHPPVEKRIAVLQSIGNSFTSLEDYNNAYRSCMNSSGSVFSKKTVTAVNEALQSQPVIGTTFQSEEPAYATREVKDMLFRMNNYSIVNCSCGTKIKVPPGKEKTACPRCGKQID